MLKTQATREGRLKGSIVSTSPGPSSLYTTTSQELEVHPTPTGDAGSSADGPRRQKNRRFPGQYLLLSKRQLRNNVCFLTSTFQGRM